MSGMAAPDHLILLLAAMGLDVYLGESAIGRLAALLWDFDREMHSN